MIFSNMVLHVHVNHTMQWIKCNSSYVIELNTTCFLFQNSSHVQKNPENDIKKLRKNQHPAFRFHRCKLPLFILNCYYNFAVLLWKTWHFEFDILNIYVLFKNTLYSYSQMYTETLSNFVHILSYTIFWLC